MYKNGQTDLTKLNAYNILNMHKIRLYANNSFRIYTENFQKKY